MRKTIKTFAVTTAALGLLLTGCASDSDTEETAPAEEVEQTDDEEQADDGEPAEDGDDSANGDLIAQLEEIQGQLDVSFEGCEWENSENDGIAQGACEEHEIGVIAGPGEDSVQSILDAIGEEGTGGYIAEDGWAVWSTDMGTVNLAWDTLGTPGTPTEF